MELIDLVILMMVMKTLMDSCGGDDCSGDCENDNYGFGESDNQWCW